MSDVTGLGIMADLRYCHLDKFQQEDVANFRDETRLLCTVKFLIVALHFAILICGVASIHYPSSVSH